jgi:multiple sugar transport system ATP-binding protein
MTSITLENISRVFPAHKSTEQTQVAVDNVSLKLHEGHTLALLGPSGCGKTTLLRLTAGLDKPDNGFVLYDGVPIDEVPIEQRGIGMVFQDYALIPHWQARRTIGFFLRLRKREQEVPERVRRVSKITGVGIEHLMGRFPRELSGGEKQRVAIARAFARDLALLLLDEPFASLDAKFRGEARIQLRRLLNELPVTTIYVTHDQHEASSLADRIAIMRAGHIVQVGTYDELRLMPDNRFVAEFMGLPPMIFFEGKVLAGEWHGENFGGYKLPKHIPDGTLVTVGIRPEHIVLGTQGIEAVVDALTPYYAERYTLLDVHAGSEQWQLQVALDSPLQAGQTIYCSLQASDIIFFDTMSGDRLVAG